MHMAGINHRHLLVLNNHVVLAASLVAMSSLATSNRVRVQPTATMVASIVATVAMLLVTLPFARAESRHTSYWAL
jgi:Zn-dependent protease with chaperone function